MRFWSTPPPVSYTHLDVYKRQRLIRRLMQRLSVRHRSQGQVRGIAAQDSKLKIKEQHTTGKSHLKNRWDFLGLQ